MNNENATYIDATGLTCPMPLMLLKQAMQNLPGGSLVHIDVTDVHAELDFEIWCERGGHTLEKPQNSDTPMRFVVIKKTSS